MRRSAIIMKMVAPEPTKDPGDHQPLATSHRYRRLTNISLPLNKPSSLPERQNISEKEYLRNEALATPATSGDSISFDNSPQLAIAESESHSTIKEKDASTCTLVNTAGFVASNNSGTFTKNTLLTEPCNISPSNLAGVFPLNDALISEQIQLIICRKSHIQ